MTTVYATQIIALIIHRRMRATRNASNALVCCKSQSAHLSDTVELGPRYAIINSVCLHSPLWRTSMVFQRWLITLDFSVLREPLVDRFLKALENAKTQDLPPVLKPCEGQLRVGQCFLCTVAIASEQKMTQVGDKCATMLGRLGFENVTNRVWAHRNTSPWLSIFVPMVWLR